MIAHVAINLLCCAGTNCVDTLMGRVVSSPARPPTPHPAPDCFPLQVPLRLGYIGVINRSQKVALIKSVFALQ